ncbi:MAG: FkbM family methyltransferase [Thermostichus sp. DG02_5_bins_236]
MDVIEAWPVQTIPLDEWRASQDIASFDFIKLDTEGSELDILRGAKQTLASTLGLSLEVLFHRCIRHQPSFSEVDHFLTEQGFRLFDLALYRHARRALPLPPPKEGNTLLGQVLWAQALYLRDGVEEMKTQGSLLNRLDLLKLASLMEVFYLPDCACELLLAGIERGILKQPERFLLDWIHSDPWIQQLNSSTSSKPQGFARIDG